MSWQVSVKIPWDPDGYLPLTKTDNQQWLLELLTKLLESDMVVAILIENKR